MNIAIYDDHQLFTQMLKKHLENNYDYEVTEINNEIVFQEFIDSNPDNNLIILDLTIDETNIFKQIDEIKSKLKKSRILILSGETDANIIKNVIGKTNGFVAKSHSIEVIMKAINTVLDDNVFICSRAKAILEKEGSNPFYIDITSLTKQEKSILKLISQGYENDKIAEKLYISSQTVKTHRKNIRSKLNLTTYSELIKFAVENSKYF